MATDNKQKVLIRSMSYNELENYLVNSDLNGKIIPKNEDTWHQNYAYVTSTYNVSSIIQNNSKLSNYLLFLNRELETKGHYEILQVMRNYDFKIELYTYGGYYIQFIPVFRPLIEYKE